MTVARYIVLPLISRYHCVDPTNRDIARVHCIKMLWWKVPFSVIMNIWHFTRNYQTKGKFAFVQIMAWYCTFAKPLLEPMMTNFYDGKQHYLATTSEWSSIQITELLMTETETEEKRSVNHSADSWTRIDLGEERRCNWQNLFIVVICNTVKMQSVFFKILTNNTSPPDYSEGSSHQYPFSK